MRTTDKPFNIDKKQVYEAYKAVKSNGGAAGVDEQTIEQFEADLQNNLYKTLEQDELGKLLSTAGTRRPHSQEDWRREDFGCAHRGDRVAQMVVKQLIEPDLDPVFLADSYGYQAEEIALWTLSGSRVSGAGSTTGF